MKPLHDRFKVHRARLRVNDGNFAVQDDVRAAGDRRVVQLGVLPGHIVVVARKKPDDAIQYGYDEPVPVDLRFECVTLVIKRGFTFFEEHRLEEHL